MPGIILNGEAGRIEAQYTQSNNPFAPVALVLHPHPLHGGTMNNKVTYNLYKIFVNNGFSVLRMNFRGVGKSQGKFSDGIGELQDVTMALNWLHDRNIKSSNFWIAGFSFGAWIALQLVMRRPEINGYILVAPPVNKYDFNFIIPCSTGGIIIQGDRDDIAYEKDTIKLVNKLSARKGVDLEYSIIQEANHFFNNHLENLNLIADEYVKRRLSDFSGQPKLVKRERRRRRKKNIISTEMGICGAIDIMEGGIMEKKRIVISPIKPLNYN